MENALMAADRWTTYIGSVGTYEASKFGLQPPRSCDSERSHSSVQDEPSRQSRKLLRRRCTPPGDRCDRNLMQVELTVSTGTLILDGVGASPLIMQLCATAQPHRSRLAGDRRAFTSPALHQPHQEHSSDFHFPIAGVSQLVCLA